jgi:hypothetical protein
LFLNFEGFWIFLENWTGLLEFIMIIWTAKYWNE